MKNALLHLAFRLYEGRGWFTRPVTFGVRIMLVRDGQVILVRHTYMDSWFFPGGSVKWGETLAEAACREAREEVGAYLHREPKLAGVYLVEPGHKSDHLALFVSDDFTLGQASDSWEIDYWSYFPMDALPYEQWRGNEARVREYLAGEFSLNGATVKRW